MTTTSQKQPTAIISFGTLFGGMEMDAFRHAKLLNNNTKVTFIVRSGSGLEDEYGKECEELGIEIKSIKFNHFFSPAIIFGVRKIVKERHIKNVIFFGASEMRSLFFSFLGLDINLIIRHGMKKTSPKKDFFHRLIYSNVNWHVSICKYISENVKDIIPFGNKSKLILIYSSLRYLPTGIKRPKPAEPKPLKLIHVSRIAQKKGQVDAIRTCKHLYDRNIPFELHIVGTIHKPFQRRFESIVSEAPYKDSIILHGFCRNVPELLNGSDIFFYPSSGEGLSNSFIEALSFGLVCISYDNTSFPELRELGFHLHIARTEDLTDLKDKLFDALSYMKNNPLPIEHNIELARKLFSPERELQQFLSILQ